MVVYQRNNVTNDVLYKQGINCLEMPSAELSRGRGGPRCMSMPAWREACKPQGARSAKERSSSVFSGPV